MPVWMITTYPRELEVGSPLVFLCPSSRPQVLSRRLGEVDEEGGHLYKDIKMLYEEDYCQELVQTWGTEDAISLVGSLSSSCLEH